MSISPAQMMLQVESPDMSGTSARTPQPAKSLVPSAAPAPESTSAAPAPATSSPSPLATDLRIDSQDQFYYEFVDGRTGSVVFEIPPEALRAIGESLNLPLNGDANANSVDVKS